MILLTEALRTCTVTARTKCRVIRFVDCTIEETKLGREEESFQESCCPPYIHCSLAPNVTLANRRRRAL
jgi:hypothetical protein